MFTYEKVINRIENSRRFGNLPGVKVTKEMLEVLGNPEKDIPYIHVAGTNGKGSVCAFLSNILKSSGLKVGVFTSPHLIDFEERITINGEYISKSEVQKLGNQLLEIDFGVNATMFDYCLAMAVLYFKEQQCDVAVYETGLGGRLDSTNALGIPEVTVITKIGFDHMAILGNDLITIATEKAGIIKKGSHLVCETQSPEVLEVFKNKAKEAELENPYFIQEEDIKKVSKLDITLNGVHQLENAAAAIKASEYIFQKYKIKSDIKEAVQNTKWPGRMEILQKEPFLMVDGAHNSNGVQALRRSLENLYPEEKFHFIMGVMADKDYMEMVEMMLPLAKDFITVTVESDRALQGEELAELINSKGVKAKNVTDIQEMLRNLRGDGKNILFGSLYFVGDVKKIIEK